MQKIRLFLFGIFGLIGAVFFIIGAVFLNKKQSRKLGILLEEVVENLEDWKKEPTTVEDKLFLEDTKLTQDMYRKGTNKDLSIECSICGCNTPRGKYFARRDNDNPDSQQPYSLICRECWEELPTDGEDYIAYHWLFNKETV